MSLNFFKKKSDTSDEPNPYEVVGTFVARVNTIEFIINHMLEMIIGTYSTSIEDQKVVNDAVDHIEEQSLRIRIYLLILYLNMAQGENPVVQGIIQDLKDFSVFYNKNLRDIRDFVAHNPVTEGQVIKVLSSRRYKGKLDSLEISEISRTTEDLIPRIKALYEIQGIVFNLFPFIVTRDLPNL